MDTRLITRNKVFEISLIGFEGNIVHKFKTDRYEIINCGILIHNGKAFNYQVGSISNQWIQFKQAKFCHV